MRTLFDLAVPVFAMGTAIAAMVAVSLGYTKRSPLLWATGLLLTLAAALLTLLFRT